MRSDPTYRQAVAHDHALVVAMLAELVDELGTTDNPAQLKIQLHEDIRAALASPRVRIFLAEVDGVPIGLGRADVLINDPIFRLRGDHRCGYIDQMFVQKAFRQRGIGAELMRRCEAWFREQGIGHSLLHAAPRALEFYARSGYVQNREMLKRL